MVLWRSMKKKILIFGTGSGGVNFFNSCRSRYRVVGFLDNNKQKHGEKLFGLKIYSPLMLKDLSFDKIIIASDYYIDIHNQLVNQLMVNEEQVEVFHSGEAVFLSGWQRLKNKTYQYFIKLMCCQPGVLSNALFHLFYGRWRGCNNIKAMPFDWLDQREDLRIHLFRPAILDTVAGPAYIGRPQVMADILLPEIALYRMKSTQVCTVSRSFILPDSRLLIERIASSIKDDADYSGGHLLYHGKKLALVRKDSPELIEKGILISGRNEKNYYHWMLEVLSQLQFVNEMPDEFNDYPILISAFSEKIESIRCFIEAANTGRNFIYLNGVSTYLVADLLLITTPNNMIANSKGTAWSDVKKSYARSESIEYLRQTAFKRCRHEQKFKNHKRIFLARKGFIRHYNQNEIIDALEKFNFYSVYMEDLSFDEQVSLIAQADMIVGPTGAAWTNIIFAKSGAKALCWMAEEWGDLSCFSNLAFHVGVEMDYISYSAGTKESRELYYQSYHLPIDDITSWVKARI